VTHLGLSDQLRGEKHVDPQHSRSFVGVAPRSTRWRSDPDPATGRAGADRITLYGW